MKKQPILALLAVSGLFSASGCARDQWSTAWDRSTGWMTASTPGKTEKEEVSPEFREAQRTFRKNTEKTMLAWARYQEDVGEYAEARKKYQEIRLAYPENIEASLGIARIEMLTGRCDQAESILQELSVEHPESVAVRLEMGRLYSHQEQWNEAITAFSRACEIAPDDQGCRYELGVACFQAGDADQALQHLTFAVGAPAAHYNIGFLLHEQGNDEEAAAWLQQALDQHPDQKTADRSRALLAQIQPRSEMDVHSIVASRRGTTSGQQDFAVDEESLPEVVAGRPARTTAEPSEFESAAVTRKPQSRLTEMLANRSAKERSGAAAPIAVPVRPESFESSLPVGELGTYEPQTESPPDASPFQTVSHSQTQAEPATGEPRQWKGPAVSGTSTPQPKPQAAPVDPPSWRPRRR